MKVLVVNAGSSSLKYQLFNTDNGVVMAKGNCERIGIEGSRLMHKPLGKDDYIKDLPLADHSAAIKLVVETLLDENVGCIKSPSEIEAIGHRVVHGGPYFTESMLVTDEVMATLEKCISYAPLHTSAHIMGIKGCTAVMPTTPQVLVFDTAFHQTMSKEVYMYGVSYDMYEDYGIRRYGAHGTSHRYVSGEMIKLMGGKAEGTKIVTCHIGNGSSITAVKDGKCVDTSMGFTPLDGIMMGTRCGSIDPAIVPFIMEKKGYTPKEMEAYMNKKCGFEGISGVSSDSRDVEKAMKEGNERAKLTYDMLCYQIKRFIGAYSASMGGLNGIVFTAGIGEHAPYIRELALSGLEYLGVKLDKERNNFGHSSEPVKISSDDSKVAVYMIPTNEELVIAKDTEAIVKAL
ncbi:MAG: acetate kinase [Ruminococcaceae bacterium]|nr:acetate kinase [Oscillospiraceae bacterium]